MGVTTLLQHGEEEEGAVKRGAQGGAKLRSRILFSSLVFHEIPESRMFAFFQTLAHTRPSTSIATARARGVIELGTASEAHESKGLCLALLELTREDLERRPRKISAEKSRRGETLKVEELERRAESWLLRMLVAAVRCAAMRVCAPCGESAAVGGRPEEQPIVRRRVALGVGCEKEEAGNGRAEREGGRK